MVCPYASACLSQKFLFRWNFCPTRINSKNVHKLLGKKISLPGLIFHRFLHFSYLSVVTVGDMYLLILLSSVARYLCSTNPTVFCGRMSGFGDKGIAVNTVYLDFKRSFYIVSHSIFVLMLGHGQRG